MLAAGDAGALVAHAPREEDWSTPESAEYALSLLPLPGDGPAPGDPPLAALCAPSAPPPGGLARLRVLLVNFPFLLPFAARAAVFHALRRADGALHAMGVPPGVPLGVPPGLGGGVAARVRRAHVFEDSRAAVRDARDLRGRVRVAFVNRLGVEEAGIDGGGLTREWMDAVVRAAFGPEEGLFGESDTEERLVVPRAVGRLEDFYFAGCVLGMALHKGVLVEPLLSPAFLKKLLGRSNQLDDLGSLDATLYAGLKRLRDLARLEGDAVGDLCLTFTAPSAAEGEPPVELLPGGAALDVDKQGCLRYIHLLANYKLNVAARAETQAFLRGFRRLVPGAWAQLFSAPELQLLISGDGKRALDLEDLQRHVNYSGGYHPSQPYVQAFWRVLAGLTPAEQADFLRFVTSCSRQPLLGFRTLQPALCVQKVRDGARLPSAATCMNLLKLPEYESEEVLREKLRYAIGAGAGFDLS